MKACDYRYSLRVKTSLIDMVPDNPDGTRTASLRDREQDHILYQIQSIIVPTDEITQGFSNRSFKRPLQTKRSIEVVLSYTPAKGVLFSKSQLCVRGKVSPPQSRGWYRRTLFLRCPSTWESFSSSLNHASCWNQLNPSSDNALSLLQSCSRVQISVIRDRAHP